MGRRDFGRYKIAEELGRGAMGVVYRATDPRLGRSVAIKAINQAYLENLGISAAEYYQRFRREAEVAGGLNHPHIVKIFDLGPDYIVMELVEGESLRAVLRARTQLTLSRVLEMVSQVADALDCAHAQGIVHRDIKPANIMLRPNGSVTVMDFGLARIESSTLTAAGEILGSASYMAPELVLGGRADAKSDIFALGVVAYELMTGERPFAGPSITSILYKIVQEPPPSAHGVNLNVPPDYDDIFAKVLAKEAAGRYQKAGDFAGELALRKWADRDPVLAARGQAAPAPGSVEEAGMEPSPLAELVPLGLAEGEEPVAEEPAAAPTFIMQAPEVGSVAPAPSDAPAAAPNVQAETTVVLPAPGAPPRTPSRIQLSGQTTWGPDSRHPKAAERTAILRTPLQPAPAESAEVPTQRAENAGAATLVLPPPSPPAVVGPDDTGPLGVTLPAIPPKRPSPPAAGSDDTGPLGPATAPLPIPRQLAPSPRRLSPALLLGGIAAVLVIGGATLAGLAYFFLHRGVPVAQALPTPSGPVAPAESEDLPPPEAEIPKSAPLAAVSSRATTEARPAPLEASAPAALSTPSPAATVPAVAPRAATEPATLLVASQPSGARVKVGSLSGTTPSRLTLQPGPVTVVVEKDGFRRWRKRLTLASGRTREVTARLRPAAAPRSASPPALVSAGDLVPLAADVTPPRRLSGDSPSYPDQAQKLKLGGSVLLEFLVTERGEVKEPKILESAGEVLDKVSIETVSRWRYQPAVKAGVKVKVKQQARFTFKARY